ncbi:branched-chain amino acid ABC transporter permease [Candidatus Sumerlaeota bacterium]|nr:branched-chain amino acid ABC transporter permease [Candidatus Sumerlaeota bacterium]
MIKLVQTLLSSISVGSLYALIALGYTMVYGTLKFINFAHASIFMLGAWFSAIIAAALLANGVTGIPAIVLSILIVMVICTTLGFVIERLAYRPLRDAPRLNVLITAIGVALLIENVAALNDVKIPGTQTTIHGFGTQPGKMPELLANADLFSIPLGSGTVVVDKVDALILGLSICLMIVLEFIIYNTRLGAAMRAASHDARTAALMGIPVDRTISITFIIGTSLAAAAGFLYVMKYPSINPPVAVTWGLLGLKAFVAAVVGGIGNVRGAVVGGLLIGILEQAGAAYLSPHFRDVYVFALLIFVLLVRPTGIFGSTAVEKV